MRSIIPKLARAASLPIETMRNCIAHNRSVDDDVYTNFLDAKEKLDKRLNSFWIKEGGKKI